MIQKRIAGTVPVFISFTTNDNNMRLGIQDIARCLDLPVSTVDRWIRQGRIPVRRSGSNWSFEVTDLKRWAQAKNLPFSLPEGQEAPQAPDTADTLVQAMERGGVFHSVPGDSVSTVLSGAAGCIAGIDDGQRETIIQALIDREELTSTGIGKGVAMPHPRIPMERIITASRIITCFPESPVDYRAVDDKPVFVLFLLLSTSVKSHLHLLSRLAYCVRDAGFLSFLQTTPRESALIDRIRTFEEEMDRSAPL